jgi:AcrR family transcriptional regulator
MSTDVSSPGSEQILQAAVRLFARKGYEATSTREIVEAAGVTKPMIYYYFKSKEGLRKAVLERFLSRFYAQLRQVLDEQRPPRDRLVEVVWTHLDYCREHRDYAKFFYADYFGPDETSLATEMVDSTSQGQELLKRACAEAAAAGLIPPGREEALLMALNGMINIWVIVAIKQEVELNREQAVGIVNDLLDGLARP